MLNVEDFGAIHDGAADDADAIRTAINAGVAQRQNVFFPRGVYRVGSSIQPQLAGVPIALVGEPGTTIRAVGSERQYLLYLKGASANVVIQDIRFQGSGVVNQLVMVSADNGNAGPSVAAEVLIVNCVFEGAAATKDGNALWDLAVGLRIEGAYGRILVQRCMFRNIWALREGVFARGLLVRWRAKGANSLVQTQYAVLRDCHFECVLTLNPSSNDEEADGAYLNAAVEGGGDYALAGSTATIEGCRFVNCMTRSVKAQVERITVRGSSFHRSAFAGQVEVNAQYGGAVVTGNTFHYEDYAVLWAISAGHRPENDSSLIVSDNIFTLARSVPAAVIGCNDVEAGDPMNRINISNNVVIGECAAFASFRVSGQTGNSAVIHGNTVDHCRESFIHAWKNLPPSSLSGTFTYNRATGGSTTFISSGEQTTVRPDVIAGNVGFVP